MIISQKFENKVLLRYREADENLSHTQLKLVQLQSEQYLIKMQLKAKLINNILLNL